MKKTLRILFVLASLAGCSQNSDSDPARQHAAFQAALDELIRLKSFTEVGLSYQQYCDRLLTAKGNIDVALQHADDEAARARINKAFDLYIAARDEWKAESESPKGMDANAHAVRDLWDEAAVAASKAGDYAFADAAGREDLDKKDRAAAVARTQEEVKARQAQENSEKERAAQELAVVTQQKAANALQEEHERKRRLAPEGIGFNTKPISITTSDTVANIPPGSELKILGENPDGTLHIQRGDLTADVAPALITNDRDVAASFRSEDQRKQDALRQWQAQQQAAAAQMPPTAPP